MVVETVAAVASVINTGLLLGFVFKLGAHDSALKDHEKRLEKMEGKNVYAKTFKRA